MVLGDRRRLALVTGRFPDPELPQILGALSRRGIRPDVLPWNGPAEWATYDLVVVRSPWDLYETREDFLRWSRDVESDVRVLNAPAVLRWCLDKRYLGELAAAGVPTVPTTFVEVGDPPRFPEVEFVVKPVTSGAARLTARYPADGVDAATRHVAELHRRGLAAMIQPYLSGVDVTGEQALVYFDGVLDHAISKGAVLARDEPYDLERDSHPSPRPHAPAPDEVSLAERALAVIPEADGLLYARVDMARDGDGRPMIMELELVDPVFFLDLSEGSAHRYAAAIDGRLDAVV